MIQKIPIIFSRTDLKVDTKVSKKNDVGEFIAVFNKLYESSVYYTSDYLNVIAALDSFLWEHEMYANNKVDVNKFERDIMYLNEARVNVPVFYKRKNFGLIKRVDIDNSGVFQQFTVEDLLYKERDKKAVTIYRCTSKLGDIRLDIETSGTYTLVKSAKTLIVDESGKNPSIYVDFIKDELGTKEELGKYIPIWDSLTYPGIYNGYIDFIRYIRDDSFDPNTAKVDLNLYADRFNNVMKYPTRVYRGAKLYQYTSILCEFMSKVNCLCKISMGDKAPTPTLVLKDNKEFSFEWN